MSETLILLGLATALAYGQIFLSKPVSLPRTIAKTLPLIGFALATFAADGPLFLAAAFALSAVGDACLSREGDRWFRLGLAAFLAAHLAYVPLFLSVRTELSFVQFGLTFALLAALISLVLVRIWPGLGDLKVPVLAYMAVIAAMGLSASQLPPDYALAMAGAVLFILSDTVLALELFAIPGRKWTPPVIWFSYIAAQTLIGMAFWLNSQSSGL